MPRLLVPPASTGESFARRASEELRLNLSARQEDETEQAADQERPTETTTDAWLDTTEGADGAVPPAQIDDVDAYADTSVDDSLRAAAVTLVHFLRATAITLDHFLKTAIVTLDRLLRSASKAVAARVAYVVPSVIANVRASAPTWRRLVKRRSGERAWQQSAWYRRLRLAPRLVAGLLFVFIASTFAVVVATKAAALTPTELTTVRATPVLTGGITLQQAPSDGTPTTPPVTYLIGVWPSDTSPPAAGSVQIFVRLTHASEAIANVPVSITISGSGYVQSPGIVSTDSYGLATFTVVYDGTSSARPIYVTASASIDGEQLSQQTYFVPQ